MIIEQKSNVCVYTTGSDRCAYCGGPRTKLLNLPGNVLVPACDEPGCPQRELQGAVECRGEGA